MKEKFDAFLVSESDGKVAGEVQSLSADRLPAGEVTVEVEYSSLNYKDALAASGLGRLVRNYPHVPGIDLAGTVIESAADEFKRGDRVIVTSYDLGVGHWGGFAGLARVPADWVVPAPEGLTNYEAMALGTAGFTAAMCLNSLERNGAKPGGGPILVTGATGGVGSLAVAIFAAKGYTVAASTGKADQHEYLRSLGASEIISREEARIDEERPRPLLKGRWAGAVDTVGGSTTSYLIRAADQRGGIALCGLVGGTDFQATVMPFLLRGVNLLGIDSAFCPMDERRAIWARLAGELKPAKLGEIAQTISLSGLPDAIGEMLGGRVKGRLVVSPGDA